MASFTSSPTFQANETASNETLTTATLAGQPNASLAHPPNYMTFNNRGSTWKRADVVQSKPRFLRRLKYYVRVLDWLPNYSMKNFLYDTTAGCATACLSIPIALSYAQSFLNIPPIYGLMAAILPPIVYTFFSASPVLSVGPEAGVCLLIGENIHQRMLSGKHPPEYAILITGLITGLIGCVTLCAGIFRLGFLDSLVSPILLLGCILSVSTVILINQGVAILGLSVKPDEVSDIPINKLMYLLRNLKNAHPGTLVISISALLFLTTSRLTKKRFGRKHPVLGLFPDAVLLLITVSFLSKHFHWHKNYGVPILGQVGEEIVKPSLPLPDDRKLDFVKHSISTAVTCSFLAFVDTVIAAKAISLQTHDLVRSNRELVALGCANIVNSMFRGLPVVGGYLRSKNNIFSGARTQVSSVMCSLFVLMALLFFMSVFYYVPKCVMASMVVNVGISMFFDAFSGVFSLLRCRAYRDITIVVSIGLLTLLFGLETGIVLGIVVTTFQVVKHATASRILFLSGDEEEGDQCFDYSGNGPDVVDDDVSALEAAPSISANSQAQKLPQTLIVRIPEPLFFANTSQLEERLNRLEKFGHPRVHPSERPWRRERQLEAIVFDLVGVSYIDSSALISLHRIFESYIERDCKVLLTSVDPKVLNQFEQQGIIALIGGYSSVYRSVKDFISMTEHSNFV